MSPCIGKKLHVKEKIMLVSCSACIHCKRLHLQYISTTTLEMYASSASGVRLQDVVHYISSTSISRSADVLRLEYISSVVLYTVKNILPFGEGKFT